MPKGSETLRIRQQVSVRIEAIRHRTEFVDEEWMSLVAGSLLAKEDGTPQKDADQNRRQQYNRRKNAESNKRGNEVKEAFAEGHGKILPFRKL